MLSIIVAMTREGVIGSCDKIPWNIKEDLEIFKKVTEGSIVIMGRKTWDSIPHNNRPLKNRINIVLSRTIKAKDDSYFVFDDFENAIEFANNLKKDIYFIGGKEIYERSLKIVDRLFISWIKKDYLGDVFFTNIDFNDWLKESEEIFTDFIFVKYMRRPRNA